MGTMLLVIIYGLCGPYSVHLGTVLSVLVSLPLPQRHAVHVYDWAFFVFVFSDTVSSKERGVRPVKRSPSPSPRRFSSRPPVGAYNLMACSSLCDLIDSNDVDLDSEVQTALGSASSNFYSCAGDGSGDFREIPEEQSPWQRWRVVFLWLALACLGFVAMSTFKATSHLFVQSPTPPPPPPPAPPTPYEFASTPPPEGDGGHGDGGCDWDCLKFLFN